MWELRRLTTLWTFTACYRDSFIFLYFTNCRGKWVILTATLGVVAKREIPSGVINLPVP
jgi:hypothetical protein